MSLRTRLTLAGGGAVFVALASASLVIYFDLRSKLHDQIDVSLIQTAQNVATKWLATDGPQPVKAASGKRPPGGDSRARSPVAPVFGSDASGYFQLIPSVGATVKSHAAVLGQVPTTSTPAQTSIVPSKTVIRKKIPPKQSLVTLNHFIPVTDLDAAVATGTYPPYFEDARYRGVAMRLYTMRLSTTSDGLV